MWKGAAITVVVNAQCEACGNQYKYKFLAREGGGGMTNVTGNLQAQLLERILLNKLKAHRCPECQYLQSWQVKEWRWQIVRRSVIAGVIVGLLTGVVAGIILEEIGIEIGSTIELVVPAITLLTIIFLILCNPLRNPNRKWRRRNYGIITPRPTRPQLSFEPPPTGWDHLPF